MEINLSSPQREYLAGLLAGFLEQCELPLKDNHPLAVEAALLEALQGISASWERIGWPQSSMLQIAIKAGLKPLYDKTVSTIADQLGRALKRS